METVIIRYDDDNEKKPVFDETKGPNIVKNQIPDNIKILCVKYIYFFYVIFTTVNKCDSCIFYQINTTCRIKSRRL